jgi:hypothetical protein
MAIEQEKRYEEIDVEALSRSLAEDNWKQDTKNIYTDDLYNLSTIVDPVTHEVQIVKEVRGHWSTLYWNLVENYQEFIRKFRKEDTI